MSHGFRFRLVLRFTPRGEPRALIALASAVTLRSPPWTDDIAQPPVRSKASAVPQTAVFDVGLSMLTAPRVSDRRQRLVCPESDSSTCD